MPDIRSPAPLAEIVDEMERNIVDLDHLVNHTALPAPPAQRRPFAADVLEPPD